MKGQIYTYIFQSVIGTGLANQDQYVVNWNELPNKPFLVTFNFYASAVGLISPNTHLPNLYINLGHSYNQVVPANNVRTTYKPNFFGLINIIAVGGRLQCSARDNPPMYLNSRPTSQNITVEIVDGMTNAILTAPIDNYTLTLSFEEL